jgi:hypothetical protein
MTITIEETSVLTAVNIAGYLSECLDEDQKYAGRPLTFRKPFAKDDRVQWFYILAKGIKLPKELERRGNRDCKRSAIQLPFTGFNVAALNRAFIEYTQQHKGRTVGSLESTRLDGKRVLFFSIRTPITPKER